MPDWNEATTRTELIDPALARAGWDLADPNQVRFEIPVDGTSPEAWQAQQRLLQDVAREGGIPYSADLPSGICDYALYRQNGEVLAVVEAKRTRIDPRSGGGAG